MLGTVEFSFGFCERGTGVYAVKVGAPVLDMLTATVTAYAAD